MQEGICSPSLELKTKKERKNIIRKTNALQNEVVGFSAIPPLTAILLNTRVRKWERKVRERERDYVTLARKEFTSLQARGPYSRIDSLTRLTNPKKNKFFVLYAHVFSDPMCAAATAVIFSRFAAPPGGFRNDAASLRQALFIGRSFGDVTTRRRIEFFDGTSPFPIFVACARCGCSAARTRIATVLDSLGRTNIYRYIKRKKKKLQLIFVFLKGGSDSFKGGVAEGIS